MIQNGIKLLLKKFNQFKIVHTAFNGEEALEYLQKNPVDLVLTDISMPKMNGIELTKAIKSSDAPTKVLVLSMHEEDQFIHDVLMVEADGYVLKNTGSNELRSAIEKVLDGGVHYSDRIVEKLAKGVKTDLIEKNTVSLLSDRELEIIQLVCDELTTKEIAKKLFLSPKTIETHRKNILRKLDFNSSTELVRFAVQQGLV